jgi:predicted MFS family arabinose efflux permease
MRPLGVRAYRRLWIVAALSNFGTWMHNTAAAAQVARLSPSPLLNTALLAAATVPVFLFAFPAGVVADRIGRGRVLFWANTLSAASAGAFAALGPLDLLGPAALLMLTFSLNTGWAIAYPAWNAEVSSVLPRDMIKDGAALNSLSFNVARTLGPAVGGYVFGVAGGGPVYLANALSFAGFVLCFRGCRHRTTTAAGSWRHTVAETLSFLRSAGHYRKLLVTSSVYFFLAQGMFALIPVYLLTVRALSDGQLGIVMAAFGAGAVGSALSYPKVRRHIGDQQLRTACALVSAAGLALLPLLASLPALIMMACCFGASFASAVTTNNAVIQTTVELPLRSRAVAVYTVVLYGAQTLGALLAGLLSTWWGPDLAAWIMGATLATLAAIRFATEFHRLDDPERREPEDDQRLQPQRPVLHTHAPEDASGQERPDHRGSNHDVPDREPSLGCRPGVRHDDDDDPDEQRYRRVEVAVVDEPGWLVPVQPDSEEQHGQRHHQRDDGVQAGTFEFAMTASPRDQADDRGGHADHEQCAHVGLDSGLDLEPVGAVDRQTGVVDLRRHERDDERQEP